MNPRTTILFLIIFLTVVSTSWAKSVRGHLIEASQESGKGIFSPLWGIFVKGPENIKKTWKYEVEQREKPQDRGKLRYKLFSVWRAPGEEAKGIIDGLVNTATHMGKSLEELISIFFSD